MSDVRIAVIGAGVMGGNHARVARNVTGGQLTAVVDQDIARATALTVGSGARAVSDVGDVIDDFDLAVVAVPTRRHHDLAAMLLEAGKHLLVEKPIAASSDEAIDMIRRSESAGRHLAVGHIERFNAAVRELPGLLDQPIHIRATRVSPYSPRISDGVVHDLMIHDLDILLSLVAPDDVVTSVSGTARSIHGDTEDVAHVSLSFASGLTASLETSRIAQQKVRLIEVTQADSVVVADLVRQDLTVHRMSRHEYLSDDGVRYRQSSVLEIPFIDQRGEPLLRELEDVVGAVRDNRPPTVTGHDGLRALELADRVSASLVRS